MNYENLLDETKSLLAHGEELINNEQYDDAIQCFEDAVKIQAEKYGEAHEGTIACMTQLGMTLLVSGKHKESEDVLSKALDNALVVYTHDCQEVAGIYYLLGTANMQLSEFEMAADNFEHLLTISRKLYGDEAKETLSALAIYNNVMAKIGGNDDERRAVADMDDDEECYKDANEYFEQGKAYLTPLYLKRAIEIRESKGQIDNDLVEYYRSLSVTYTELNLNNEAIEVLKKLLDITIKINGDVDISVSGTHNLLGYNYMVINEYDEAIKHLNKCVSLDIKIYGEKSLEVLRDYNVLGNVYRMADEFDKALATFVIMETIAPLVEDDNARDILVNTYTDIAAIYMHGKKYEQAHEYLHKKLHLCMHLFGKISQEVYETYNQLLTVAGQMNNDEEIAEILKNIDEIRAAAGHDEQHHHDGCTCGCHDHHHDDCCEDDCCCHNDGGEA